MTSPLKVLYDGEAFFRHRRSGISRYFSELVAHYRTDPSYGVDAVTPYRWVANAHLAERVRGRYFAPPLPGRMRQPVLERVNRVHRLTSSERPARDLVHHSLVDPTSFDRWTAPVHVATIYDFLAEMEGDDNQYSAHAAQTQREVMRRTDAVLCISAATRDALFHYFPDYDKPVIVTPLGVGEEFFSPRSPRVELPERYVLFVGNRHPHKNAAVLFEAMSRLIPGRPDLHLVLCGAWLPEEDAILAAHGLDSRTVRIRPSDADLPGVYARAAAFVFPSRYEGFGLPAVEAMAAGAPLLASRIPALIEVTDGNAVMFDPDDVDELVSELERVLDDPDHAKDLRDRGRRRALDYTWARTAAVTSDAYRTVLANT